MPSLATHPAHTGRERDPRRHTPWAQGGDGRRGGRSAAQEEEGACGLGVLWLPRTVLAELVPVPRGLGTCVETTPQSSVWGRRRCTRDGGCPRGQCGCGGPCAPICAPIAGGSPAAVRRWAWWSCPDPRCCCWEGINLPRPPGRSGLGAQSLGHLPWPLGLVLVPKPVRALSGHQVLV